MIVATAFDEPTPMETVNRPTAAPDNGNAKLVRSSAPRPEVLKAIRALREMPPFAREREIDFGRYSHFSPAERQLLRNLGAQSAAD